jgi:DnaK suppressor protein
MNASNLDLQKFRAQLVAEREALSETESVRRDATDAEQRDQGAGALTAADGAQDQAMARATQMRAEQRFKRIDAALARIADGSYGDCLRCGEPIDPRRLEADPTATLCLTCAEQT